MENLGRLLLVLALLVAVAGVALLLLSRLGVDRLPGDMVYERKNVTVYVPLGLMIVVSIVLTIALNLFGRR